MTIWTIGRAAALPFRENMEDMEATKFFVRLSYEKEFAKRIEDDIIKLSNQKEIFK